MSDKKTGKSDRFDRVLGGFAALYVDQAERDFEALDRACSDGALEVAAV